MWLSLSSRRKISVTFRQVRQFYLPESLRLFLGRRLPSNLGYTTTPAFLIKMKKKNIQLKGNVKWRTHTWRELFQDKMNTQNKYSGQVGRVPVLSLWHLSLFNSKMSTVFILLNLAWVNWPSSSSSIRRLTPFPADAAGKGETWDLPAPSSSPQSRRAREESGENGEKWRQPPSSYNAFIDLKRQLCAHRQI